MYLFTAVEQDEDALVEEISKAHVICIVYSISDDASIQSVRN